MERRTFLGAAMLSLIGTGAAAAQTLTPPARPDDEAAWRGVANAYPARPDTGIINLEFGAFGQMPKLVQAAFETYARRWTTIIPACGGEIACNCVFLG